MSTKTFLLRGQVCIPADLLVDAGRPIPIVKP